MNFIIILFILYGFVASCDSILRLAEGLDLDVGSATFAFFYIILIVIGSLTGLGILLQVFFWVYDRYE
jgi:hypothetical protein